MSENSDFGGPLTMKSLTVNPVHVAPERVSVFRSSPFEVELTAPASALTLVVGGTQIVETRQTQFDSPAVRNWCVDSTAGNPRGGR